MRNRKTVCAVLALILLLGVALLPSCAGGKTDPTPTGSGAVTDVPTSAPTSGQTPTPSAPKTEVDLILFMGDLNMAGRGDKNDDIAVSEGHAYEFRAVSDPTKLYPLTADFGAAENLEDGIDDGENKTGSLVPSFCEAYYAQTGVPVVAVSASVGGVDIAGWRSGNGILEDAVNRLEAAKAFLAASETHSVRHIFAVWSHGETDAAKNVTAEDYQSGVRTVVRTLTRRGVEKCFLIACGSRTDAAAGVQTIRAAQEALCGGMAEIVPVSTAFSAIPDELIAPDRYTQAGYRRVGANAGENAGRWVLSPDGYEMLVVKPPVEERDDFDGDGIDLPEDSFRRLAARARA